MATTSEAADRLAECTGIPAATVRRTARLLREADVTLWPQGSQGRGQAAHVEPSHLVNLVLALTVADTSTRSAEQVNRFRAFAPLNGSHFGLIGCTPEPPERPVLIHLPVPGSFGETVESLVHTLATDAMWRQAAVSAVIKIDLETGFVPRAEIACTVGDPALPNAYKDSRAVETFKSPQRALALTPGGKDAGIVHRVTVMPWVLLTMADLWADTIHHRERRAAKANASGGGATQARFAQPENETAADRPLQGTDAAALSDQLATAEPDGRMQGHSTGERGFSQPISGLQADRSLHVNRNHPNAQHRPRHDPTDRAAA